MTPEDRQLQGVGPYILVSDDDGHWYVIPKAKRVRWEVFVESPEDGLPTWANSLGCSPSNVEFMDYEVAK